MSMAPTVSLSKRLFLNTSFLLVVSVFMLIHFHSSELPVLHTRAAFGDRIQDDCENFHKLEDYKAKCLYLKSNDPCVSQGYIDYLYLFYCELGRFPLLGHTLLFLWLLVLFYLLANTASEYFCPSLESLSKLLKLSPTISGVTLLSLGNGANDVFSSLVSFKDRGTSGIGFNTVLGGAFFVSCVVVGIVSVSIRHRGIQVRKSDFMRDVCLLLLVLPCLLAILITGQINFFVAMGFLLIYIVYVIAVYVSSTRWKGVGGDAQRDANPNYVSDSSVPLLSGREEGVFDCNEEGNTEFVLKIRNKCCCMRSSLCQKSLWVLEMPLHLPRRLTIPVVCEGRWSKPYAVSSVILAPLLLSVLSITYKENDLFNEGLIICGIGLLIGTILGVTAFFTTKKSRPPKSYLFPWLAGGFIMSVTWSYILAQELVGLLVSLGYICGVSPSILGLTVLAWGNSIGDLTTNLTMALSGGAEGAQVAISGCYAGPIFNTLVGLGLSLVCSTWSEYPSSVVIPRDPYLVETLTFFFGGLVWALVVLTRRDMRLDGVLGGGLLVIYFISLLLRLIQTLGCFQLHDMLVFFSKG